MNSHKIKTKGNKNLLAYGENKSGQLGTGDSTNLIIPRVVLRDISVKKVCCGWVCKSFQN